MNFRIFGASVALSLTAMAVACGSDDPASSNSSSGGTASVGSDTGGSANSSNSSNSGGSTAVSSTNGGTSGNATSTGTAGSGSSAPVDRSPFAGKLYINELVPSNKTGAADESGSFPDWLELYNDSSEDISVASFFMSDSADNPSEAVLAAGLVVKSKSTLLLWADGDIDQGVLHLPFKLSAAGESVSIFDKELKLIDTVSYPQASSDASYSRLPDGTGEFAWCAKSTPNQVNGSACTP
ncbi:MAG TPA: lamin tail domain-containing protein [Polyangiaceae bacterium]